MDAPAYPGLLRHGGNWLELSDADLRSAGDRPSAVQVNDADVLTSVWGPTPVPLDQVEVEVDDWLRSRVQAVSKAPPDQQADRWVLRVGQPDGEGASIEEGFAVHDDGSVVAVSPCAEAVTTTIAGFVERERAAGRPATGVDVVRSYLTDPDKAVAGSLDAFFDPPPPAWVDLPPDRRSIGPDETPADVLTGLRPVTFVVTVPAEWRDGAQVLSSRTDFGWSESGVALGASSQGLPLRITQYVRPTDVVELTLTGSSNRYDDEHRVIATVDLAQMAGRSEIPVVIDGPIDQPTASITP